MTQTLWKVEQQKGREAWNLTFFLKQDYLKVTLKVTCFVFIFWDPQIFVFILNSGWASAVLLHISKKKHLHLALCLTASYKNNTSCSTAPCDITGGLLAAFLSSLDFTARFFFFRKKWFLCGLWAHWLVCFLVFPSSVSGSAHIAFYWPTSALAAKSVSTARKQLTGSDKADYRVSPGPLWRIDSFWVIADSHKLIYGKQMYHQGWECDIDSSEGEERGEGRRKRKRMRSERS